MSTTFDISTLNNMGITNIYAESSRKWVSSLRYINIYLNVQVTGMLVVGGSTGWSALGSASATAAPQLAG